MTTTSKAWLAIGVIAVAALVIVFAVRTHTSREASRAQSTDDATLPTPASDTSDAALVQDSAAIDAQMKGLDSDSATVDQGISETQ